ncbi:MAG: hypothetical protein EA413_11755 [Cyanobium sp. PLM2.Bin73]|jgi:hypothetical protein|nr:MAG: hypothetical protein EA413_11755 [Cyanobium sp. PLM2.Bin73]
MNLVEVLVAGSLVLGSATGSLGIWANTARATRGAEDLLAQQRAADARLLAVQARLQALAAERRQGAVAGEEVQACPAVQELGLEAADVILDATGPILTVTVQVDERHRRTRVFDLAVYGLCPAAGGAP